MPRHAIREPELADPKLTIPKIPLKGKPAPAQQLQVAEIVEQSELPKPEPDESDISALDLSAHLPPRAKYPELNNETLKKAFSDFADKQKVSLVSLIKLLIPDLSGKQVSVSVSKQQEEYIGELKIDWQAFLKDYFNDPEITLGFIIDENAITQRKAYTQAEQFEEMLGENELFRKMVNQFKLKLKH